MNIKFTFLLIYFVFIASNVWSSNKKEPVFPFDIGDINKSTVSRYSSVKEKIEEIFKKDPQSTVLFVSDYDQTIMSSEICIGKKVFRDTEGYIEVKNYIKDNPKVDCIIATARWHHSDSSIPKFEEEYLKMYAEIGGHFACQKTFGKLKFDFREDVKNCGKSLVSHIPELEEIPDHKMQRGVFIQGVCYTGSIKPLVVMTLLKHDLFPVKDISHIVFIDDDSDIMENFEKGLCQIKQKEPVTEKQTLNWHLLHYKI